MGDTKIKLTYFGKKRPKKVDIEVGADIVEHYVFEPFATTEVSEKAGRILLRNAPDIFKRIDKDERKPITKPIAKTDGYVGDVHASAIPDLNKKIEEDAKEEEGKDVEQIIEEVKDKEETLPLGKNKGKGKK